MSIPTSSAPPTQDTRQLQLLKKKKRPIIGVVFR